MLKTMYVYDCNSSTKKVATVVYDVYPAKHSRSIVEFSIAFCNPKDQFVNKIGRKMAMERFENGLTNSYEVGMHQTLPNNILYKIKCMIEESVNIPFSVKKRIVFGMSED